MIKIAICDDDKNFLIVFEKKIREYLNEISQSASIQTYQSGEFFLFDVQENHFFDLVFLDIEMPKANGMDITREIKRLYPDTLIIFITSHSEYAIESFELSIFRYIPKNNINQKLLPAIKDAISYIELKKDKYYTISTPTKFKRIPYASIFFIQKDGKYSIFHTDSDKILYRKPLHKVYQELDTEQFIYIDRSCIVNIFHILHLDESNIILVNGEALAVSQKRLKDVRSTINLFWSKRL